MGLRWSNGRAACIGALATALLCSTAPGGAAAGSVLGGKRSSARIRSFHYYFAGIIPDFLTDTRLNPARIREADSLNAVYTYGSSFSYGLPFPVADGDFVLEFGSTGSEITNELRLIGGRALGWSWELDLEFAFEHDEWCYPTGNVPISRNMWGDLSIQIYDDCRIEDDRFVRASIAGAREIGGAVIGVRAGGGYVYDALKDHNARDRHYYEYNETSEDHTLRERRFAETLLDREQKHLSLYVESGMAWGSTGEIVLRAGYAEGRQLFGSYGLEIFNHYDRYTNEIDEYAYTLSEYRSDREGEAWSFGAYIRGEPGGGLILTASGNHESGDYTSWWRDDYSRYAWGGYDDLEVEDRLRFPGDGTRSMSEAILKAGRTFALGEKIGLTPGARLYWSRTGCEESGSVSAGSYMEYNGTVSSFGTELPASFERTDTRLELDLPLAIEFRPAPWFHLYSGFGMRFYWDRSVEKESMLIGYVDPGGMLPDGSEDEENYTTSRHYAVLGFSLRYRDRLFFDMYNGSDVTPDNLQHYYVNIRYVF